MQRLERARAANSIAVIFDAVNNLTDALSSVITILGTKLTRRKPDREHPLGHGRYEYVSALVISLIVLYAGFSSLEESIREMRLHCFRGPGRRGVASSTKAKKGQLTCGDEPEHSRRFLGVTGPE